MLRTTWPWTGRLFTRLMHIKVTIIPPSLRASKRLLRMTTTALGYAHSASLRQKSRPVWKDCSSAQNSQMTTPRKQNQRRTLTSTFRSGCTHCPSCLLFWPSSFGNSGEGNLISNIRYHTLRIHTIIHSTALSTLFKTSKYIPVLPQYLSSVSMGETLPKSPIYASKMSLTVVNCTKCVYKDYVQ